MTKPSEIKLLDRALLTRAAADSPEMAANRAATA